MRCALLVAFALSLPAQESRFDVRSRLVFVPATVTDAKGRPVDGLQTSDFLVLDNGRAQKAAVDTIDTGDAPIALVIAVQSSGISSAVLEKVQKIEGMIPPLITGERGCAALISFSERVTWLQECTADPDALQRAFDQLRPGEPKRACMLDAVQAAVAYLSARPNGRRVLLLISESRDRGSETDLDVATIAAQSAGVTVYAATYSAFKTAFTSKSPVSAPTPRKDRVENSPIPTPNGNPPSRTNPSIPPPEQRVDILAGIGELARLHKTDTAKALTVATGGTTLPFTRQKGLEDAIEKLGAELHTGYLLSFVPDSSTAGYHRLEVRVTRSGEEFHIRARPGYWMGQ